MTYFIKSNMSGTIEVCKWTGIDIMLKSIFLFSFTASGWAVWFYVKW